MGEVLHTRDASDERLVLPLRFPFLLFTAFSMVILWLMNDGRRLRRQERQAVVDGSQSGTVKGNGEEGDFAEGEVDGFFAYVSRNP